jgi:hypothetical protein
MARLGKLSVALRSEATKGALQDDDEPSAYSETPFHTATLGEGPGAW